MVRCQSMSRRGPAGARRAVEAPATAWTVLARSRSSSSSVTVRTTVRAVSRERSGMTPAEPDERADQVDVGLDRLHHLRLEQQLPQAEPVHRVGLHHLHDGGREVGADVAEPARHLRRGAAQPAAPVGVVQRLQGTVPRWSSSERHGPPPASPSPSGSWAASPRTSRQRISRSRDSCGRLTTAPPTRAAPPPGPRRAGRGRGRCRDEPVAGAAWRPSRATWLADVARSGGW